MRHDNMEESSELKNKGQQVRTKKEMRAQIKDECNGNWQNEAAKPGASVTVML